MIRSLAPLLLALSAVAALAQQRPERVLAADVTPAGELVTVTLRAPDRLVFSTRRGHVVAKQEVELVGVPADAEIVQARVGPYLQTHFVALVLRRGEEHAYHFAVPAGEPPGPRNPFPQLPRYVISEPVFTSGAPAYRLLSAAGDGGGSIEIVFQRGWAPGDAGAGEGAAGRMAQRVYHVDSPASGAAAGTLWNVTQVRAAR